LRLPVQREAPLEFGAELMGASGPEAPKMLHLKTTFEVRVDLSLALSIASLVIAIFK
jgi:hypothetical protein